MVQALTRKVTLSLPEELLAYADAEAAQEGWTRYRFYAEESENFAARTSKAVAEAIDDGSTW